MCAYIVSNAPALQTTGLGNAITTYHKAASSGISSIQQSIKSLIEQGTREDTATGLTPKKRVWQYVDEWELTQSREVVLNAWRQGGSSNAGSDTFIAECVPLPTEDTENEEEGDVEAMIVDPVISPKQSQREGPDPESPVTLSAASSTSAPPPTKKTLKLGLSALGTLTDRPTNVITQRGSRRVR